MVAINLDKILKITIFLLFFIPPLVFMPGNIDGQWIFVNYTHPKLAAVMIISWAFLLLFSIKIKREARLFEKVKEILKDPFTIILFIFIIYSSVTAFQTLVLEASIYELAQYWTLFLLFVALSSIINQEQYLRFITGSICISFFIMVAIGFVQMVIFIPWLRPVGSGANFPSTMGYKNPAALALTGQWFFLLYLNYFFWREKKMVPFFAIATLSILEAGFIAALQSRTAYFAFFTTLLLLAIGIVSNAITQKGKRATSVVLGLICIVLASFMIFASVIKIYPKASERLEMITVYIKSPSKFLETDRATYIFNSIHMANDNLLGVGIGNWRFAYPLYRVVQPKLWFNRYFQVQKAHCDYAQILGETGWPGLIIWLALLGVLFIRGAKLAIFSESLSPMFLMAQFSAFLLLMMFDYCIQMPYHKFAFFGSITILFSYLNLKKRVQ